MSIVVAVVKDGETCVAADSQSNFGTNQVPMDNGKVSKLRQIGASVLGTTGWGVYENILEDFISAKKPPLLSDRQSIFSFFLDLWKALHERYPYVNDQWDTDRSPFANLDASFLIASPDGLFYVASDLSVTRFEKYFAVGSGADFSMGALYNLYDTDLDAAAITRKAVESAMAFNIYCGGEVQLITLARP